MDNITFDTHEFVKDLIGAGMPETQAEVLARAQAEMLNNRLVSREYFDLRLAQFGDVLKHDLTLRLASLQVVTVSLIAGLIAVVSWV